MCKIAPTVRSSRSSAGLKSRQIALELLLGLERSREDFFESLAAHRLLAPLVPVDRRLVQELVSGACKMQRRLDFILNQFLTQKKTKLDPLVRSILRLALYQLEFLTRVPDFAAVNSAVELARERALGRKADFLNGLLRSYLRNREKLAYPERERNPNEYLGIYYSYPDWLVARWVDEFGPEETEKLCAYGNRKSSLTLRVNTFRTSVEKIIAQLEQVGVRVMPGKFFPQFLTPKSEYRFFDSPWFKNGFFYVQDESAAAAVHLLDPKPGETIWDACAAPGGKATHVAELTGDTGTVLASDLSLRRTKLIKENSTRLRLNSVIAVVADGLSYHPKGMRKILLDVPCTGLGTVARNPDLRWHKKPEDIPRLAQLQWELLTNAVMSLPVGGVLVYSSCTLTREENQELMEKFIHTHPRYRLEPAGEFVPPELVDGFGYVAILPQKHGIDGAFAARFRRIW